MKKHTTYSGLLLTFTLLLPVHLSAQRNAPVVGDVAQLIDILKKDYSTISKDRRHEEITNDQSRTISFFKSYLTDGERTKLKQGLDNPFVKKLTELDLVYIEYQQKKNLVNAYSSNTYRPDTGDKASILATNFSNAQDSADNLKIEYYKLFSASNIIQLEQIQLAYRDENPFIDSTIGKFIEKFKLLDSMGIDQFASVNHNSAVKKAIPFIGGDLSFEMLIDGLGRFLAQRIKDELTSHVFSKIHEWLDQTGEDDPFAEFKVILPRTTEYLKTLEANGVSSFGEEIKQYIEDDINHMLKNAVNLKDTPRFRNLIRKYPDVDFAFEALEIIPLISEIKTPIEYFDLLENSRSISRWKNDDSPLQHNLANTIHFTSMLAHSMIVMDNGEERFAGTDFLTGYIGEEEFMRLYLGFLYQQNSKYYDIHFLMGGTYTLDVKDKISKPITTEFGLRTALQNYMILYNEERSQLYKVKDDFKFFKELIMELGEQGKLVYIQAAEIRKLNKLGTKVDPEIVHSFIEGLLKMTEHTAYACDTTINYLFEKANYFSGIDSVSQKDKSLSREQIVSRAEGTYKYNRLNLVEKTSSFVAVSRTCNDAWIDVVNKKYALGLLKLIEVTGQLITPENEFVLFQKARQITNQLSHMVGLEKNTDWYSIVSLINTAEIGKSIEIGDDLKLIASRLVGELNRIMIFEERISPTKASNSETLKFFKANLVELKEQFVDMATGSDWHVPSTQAKLDNITKLLASSDFKSLIVSYYSGVEITSLIEELKTKMPEIKIDGRELFTKTEVNEFTNRIQKYLEATFDYFFLSKKRNKGNYHEDMMEIHDELLVLTKDYLLLIPEKFDWKINPNVIKVVHLINDIAVAEDGEDVENIIEHFALPPGSSSIKRKSLFNVSLNAYPGLIGGGDLSWNNKSSYLVGTASFTAPVGLSFSWGSKNGFSNGLFISVIDIGAVTRFRFDNDTTTTLLTKLRFQDIFAPGLYYSLGFKKSPISLNIGAQYGPELRTILPDGSGTFLPSMRFGVGITVDIPLLNIYTKPRLE